MIPGTIVAMGGQDWTVPAITIAQLRTFLPRIQQLSGLDPAQMGTAQLDALMDVVATALQRNYPEVTKAQVEDILDLGNALPVLNAILGGIIKLPAMEPKPIDDHAAVGELSGFQSNETAPWPWRPNPPVVGS